MQRAVFWDKSDSGNRNFNDTNVKFSDAQKDEFLGCFYQLCTLENMRN